MHSSANVACRIVLILNHIGMETLRSVSFFIPYCNAYARLNNRPTSRQRDRQATKPGMLQPLDKSRFRKYNTSCTRP